MAGLFKDIADCLVVHVTNSWEQMAVQLAN